MTPWRHTSMWIDNTSALFESTISDVILLPLSKGKSTTVDRSAGELIVRNGPWFAVESNGGWYAVHSDKHRHVHVFLHRLLLECPPGTFCDHINRDTLDNRRSNLRFATRSENGANRAKMKRGTSIYIGVSSGKGRWVADIRKDGKRIHLGTFTTELDAATAYDRAALLLHGTFASLNFPNN
jgi:hypothetical protein